MKVNFVLSGMSRERFTAGQLIVLEHAHELARRGHDVTLIPTIRSYRPEWFDVQVRLIEGPRVDLLGAAARATRALLGFFLSGRRNRPALTSACTDLSRQVAGRAQLAYTVAAMTDRLRQVIPPADVTLATGFSTALPVWLCGSGVRAYFMQHHEVLFTAELPEPEMAEAYADLTYRLPLQHIANCSWLVDTIADQYGSTPAALVLNAIDHRRYYPDGQPDGSPLTVVSYSGRAAPWKDLHTAARAIRIARETVPDLRWLVYGGPGLLPPDNVVAPYEAVGFLAPDALRRLYSRAHLLLATSWYESFPLYPLEAMACGCAVVTTPLGTEDFAVDGYNARVVPPREPERMAAAIVELWRRPELRAQLAVQACDDAKRFNWAASGDQMERTLTDMVAPVPGVTT